MDPSIDPHCLFTDPSFISSDFHDPEAPVFIGAPNLLHENFVRVLVLQAVQVLFNLGQAMVLLPVEATFGRAETYARVQEMVSTTFTCRIANSVRALPVTRFSGGAGGGPSWEGKE